jgi:hypothetical protein
MMKKIAGIFLGFAFFCMHSTLYAQDDSGNYPNTIYPRNLLNGQFFGTMICDYGNPSLITTFEMIIVDYSVQITVVEYDAPVGNVPTKIGEPLLFRYVVQPHPNSGNLGTSIDLISLDGFYMQFTPPNAWSLFAFPQSALEASPRLSLCGGVPQLTKLR